MIGRLVACYVRLTHRIVIRGTLPGTPCVAVSLHRSYWDGLLICMLDPRITAVTSRAWKSVLAVGPFLETYGVIWTEDDVITKATRYVRDGGVCWLAPWGYARSGERPHPHSGAAQIAHATGAPIVSVTLDGGRRRWLRRRRLTILIGEPTPTAVDESVESATDRLIASLRAQERQSVAMDGRHRRRVPLGPGNWSARPESIGS